jgi:integrase
VWLSGHGRTRKCLGTADRHEAERLGRALLAELLAGNRPVTPSALTLADLWRRYRTECSTFLDNSVRSRQEAVGKARTMLAYFGADRCVRDLTADDLAAYGAARRAGGIKYGEAEEDVTRAVRARAVEADLKLLSAMLRWATQVRVGNARLLDLNPIAGVRLVRERNPRRATATWDRFVATRKALQTLQADTESETLRTRWRKVELALVLAEATGRRLGSIRQLRWEDIDFERAVIHWRGAADKKQRDWKVPMPDGLSAELKAFRRAFATVGGWLFPAETNPAEPMDRYAFGTLLAQAEAKAELPKLEGALWHAYRRAWATARKHLPIVDVAAAGGWKDTSTLLTCYTQPTNDAMLAVMNEPAKLRDVAVSGRNSP